MDVATIGSLIGTVGFPIVACGALFWMINNMNNRMDKMNEQHKQEQDKIVEAVNNNTIAITRLITKLGGDTSEN
jgi:cellobiose-specific phosphotransferase system component IIC